MDVGHYMESPQCLGRYPNKEDVNPNLCFPSTKEILKRVKKAVNKVKAKYVYVATDNNPMVDKITKHLQKKKVGTVT